MPSTLLKQWGKFWLPLLLTMLASIRVVESGGIRETSSNEAAYWRPTSLQLCRMRHCQPRLLLSTMLYSRCVFHSCLQQLASLHKLKTNQPPEQAAFRTNTKVTGGGRVLSGSSGVRGDGRSRMIDDVIRRDNDVIREGDRGDDVIRNDDFFAGNENREDDVIGDVIRNDDTETSDVISDNRVGDDEVIREGEFIKTVDDAVRDDAYLTKDASSELRSGIDWVGSRLQRTSSNQPNRIGSYQQVGSDQTANKLIQLSLRESSPVRLKHMAQLVQPLSFAIKRSLPNELKHLKMDQSQKNSDRNRPHRNSKMVKQMRSDKPRMTFNMHTRLLTPYLTQNDFSVPSKQGRHFLLSDEKFGRFRQNGKIGQFRHQKRHDLSNGDSFADDKLRTDLLIARAVNENIGAELHERFSEHMLLNDHMRLNRAVNSRIPTASEFSMLDYINLDRGILNILQYYQNSRNDMQENYDGQAPLSNYNPHVSRFETLIKNQRVTSKNGNQHMDSEFSAEKPLSHYNSNIHRSGRCRSSLASKNRNQQKSADFDAEHMVFTKNKIPEEHDVLPSTDSPEDFQKSKPISRVAEARQELNYGINLDEREERQNNEEISEELKPENTFTDEEDMEERIKRRINDGISQCIQSYCSQMMATKDRVICIIRNCNH